MARERTIAQAAFIAAPAVIFDATTWRLCIDIVGAGVGARLLRVAGAGGIVAKRGLLR